MSDDSAQIAKPTLHAEPILEVDLGDNGGKLRFFTLQEINDWVLGQINFLQWINQYSNQGEISSIWSSIHQFQARFQQTYSYAQQNANNVPNYGGYLPQLKNVIEQEYRAGKILASNSVNAKFIEKFRAKDAVAAIYAYAYLIRYPITLNNPNALRGALEAYLYEKGMSGSTDSEKKALAELRSKVQQDFESDGDKLKALVAQAGDLNERNDAWHTEQVQHFESMNSAQQEQFKSALETNQQMMANDRQEALEELKKIQQTFSVGLAAEAPVTHWENKRKKHAQYAKRYIAATTLIIAAIIAAFGYIIFPWLTVGLTPDKSPAYWKLLVTFLAASFSFWVIRILVTRLILNQVDRHDDAEERATLVTTFLALLRTEAALDEKDKSVILPIIFRAANTGSTKEEGPSVSIIEEALKNILKR